MSGTEDQTPTLGFVGLGVMGGPMCRNLAAGSGALVMVHDVNPKAVQAILAKGIEATESVAALARDSDIIFLSLPGEAESRAVCLAEDGLLAAARNDQIIVDCGTVPLSVSRELAAAFAAKGAVYVDAPVAGTAQSVATGKISIMVGLYSWNKS